MAEERARWAKLHGQLLENYPVRDKKTGKWGIKGTSETFHSDLTALNAMEAMLDVSRNLKDGDVKGAKRDWKWIHRKSKWFWYGRTKTEGRRNRDKRYGRDKAGKARAKADEAAQRNVIDSMWHDVKKAEAKGLKPVKASAPAK